jgi:hypothetical protein
MDPVLKNLAKEVDKIQRYASEIQEVAILAGMSPLGANLGNSITFLRSLTKQWSETEELAQNLGYKSVAIALKALGQMKVNPTQLPEVFQVFPAHWLEDTSLEPLSKRVDGLTISRVYKKKAVSSTQAQMALRKIQPDLVKLYAIIQEDDDLLDEVISAYSTLSYKEFCKSLYTALRNWTSTDETT